MEEEQILDFTPITPLVGEPNPSPQQSSLKKFSDYFKDIKQDDKPVISINESDLGKFAGKFLPTASLNRLLKGDENLETEFALTQSVGERMVNSMKISGANILATSLGLLAEIPDMISTGEIIGENAPIAKGLFDWRNEVQKNNTPYETYYDKENPFKSILLPGFLTGSSKGWGTIVENASYGIGAGIGIAAEEAMFTAITGGIGSIPVLAKSLAKLVKLSKNTKDLAKYIEQGGTALKSIDNALDVSEEALSLAKKEKFFADVLEGTKDVYRTTAMSYSEAQMEALEGKNNYIEQQKLNFRKTFGYDATGKELEEINKKSSDIYTARFTANMALLGASNYVSNRVFFGGLDKLKDSLNKFKNEGIEGTIDQLGNLSFADDTFKLKTNSQWWEKGFGKGIKKGIEFGVNTVKSVPLALSEGVEEGGQFIIDKATNNYFAFDNKKAKQDLITSITNATKDFFTTTEGQQSMLLGMLGGSGQQVVGNIAQSIGDKALTGTEGYVPLKERKALKIKQLNEFASQYNTPEVGAVNVNSVFGTLDKKFKNTSKLLAASGALDEVLGNKELERRVVENISFNTLAPFVEMGMGNVAKEMFKYRIDSLTDEEWTSTGIKKSKNEIMSDFSTKIKTVEEAFDMSNKKFINPYTKDTEDYDRFEDVKNNYAYTLYQIQRDVKEADKIKQTHNKYFNVLKNFANVSTLKDGRQYINNKIKENKDRIGLLQQSESTQFTKDELKKAKLVLKNYEEIKSELSPIGMKKKQYSKMLDKLIFTTNYEYSFPEDVLDKGESIEAIQNYLDIQTRIKSNLEDVKLIQGGSWEENKKFILKKKKEAEVLDTTKKEVVVPIPPIINTSEPNMDGFKKGDKVNVYVNGSKGIYYFGDITKENINGSVRLENGTNFRGNQTFAEVRKWIKDYQSISDKAETINKEREDNFEYALEEVGEKRISDFNQILDGGKLQQEFFSAIAKEVRGNKKLQTKEDFVQALNEFIDEYFKELNTAEETSTIVEISKEIKKEIPIVNKIPSFPASKNKVAYMVGQENSTPTGMNYKKAMQEAIFLNEFILTVGEERPATINTKDDVLIIEGNVEKPILFNGKEIGTIAPSGTYKIKPEFENTEIALKLTPYIEIKDELYNSKEIKASYKATDFNTSIENGNKYQDVSLQDSRFTKFLYFSKRLGKNVLIDRVVIEQYEENGKQKYDFIDSLSYDGLSDKKDRDVLREELIEVFEKSGSKYKKENQYFVFMIGRSEEKGQFLNIQPINIPNKTKTATEEIESFFDVEDAELLQKKLLYDENKPTDMKGWNDEYRLIDKSKYTDALRNVGTPEKTPNIKIFVNKNAQNKVDSLSLQIEGQNKDKSWKITKAGTGYRYGSKDRVFDSVYDIIKEISPNYEIRTAKLAGQEREHSWALQNFRIGEQIGKVYNQQQFILSPLDKPKENSEIIELNKFEMKEEKVVSEQIIVRELNENKELSSIILITDVDNFVKKEFTPEVIEMIYNKLKDGKQKDVITPIYESYLNGELEPMEKYLSDPKRMNSILKLNLPLKDVNQAQFRNVNNEIQNKLNEYLNNCK